VFNLQCLKKAKVLLSIYFLLKYNTLMVGFGRPEFESVPPPLLSLPADFLYSYSILIKGKKKKKT